MDSILIDTPNPRAAIGGNRPPDAIETAREHFKALARFLDENPVVTDGNTSEAKLYFDRGKAAIAELVAAKEAETGPLHKLWKAALDKFKPATEHLTGIVAELESRMDAYVKAERARREAEAETARKAAEDAAEKAREALRAELEARDNASVGEVGAGVISAMIQSDTAVQDAERAARLADVAARDAINTRISGGFGRSFGGSRKAETLILEDAVEAVKVLGLTDKIRDAIISDSRAYRKLHRSLPKGVISQTE